MTQKGNSKESVMQYLVNQNRPYSANDVMQNLHNEFGKTAIQKALDDLTSEGKIREKTYGKQKVYSAIQEESSNEDDIALELVTLDSKMEEASEKLKAAEQELKKTEETLQQLLNAPSTELALSERDDLKEEIDKLQQKIENLSKNSCEITDKEKKQITKSFETCSKEFRKRKQICMDIVNSIMESYPKKLKTLFEEIGIEPDEVS